MKKIMHTPSFVTLKCNECNTVLGYRLDWSNTYDFEISSFKCYQCTTAELAVFNLLKFTWADKFRVLALKALTDIANNQAMYWRNNVMVNIMKINEGTFEPEKTDEEKRNHF